jgi:hypothetical protein
VSSLRGRGRRYTIGFDTPMMEGYARAWPKKRAIARAHEIVDSQGGSAIVARVWKGELEIVAEVQGTTDTEGQGE